MCIAWKFSIIRACKEHLYRKFDDNLVSTAKNTLLEPPHQGHSNDVFLWCKISSNSLVFSLSKFSLLQLFCICTIYFLNRVTLIICMLRAKKQKQNSTHNFGISRLKDKFFKQIRFICDKTRFLLNRAGQAKLQIWAFFAIIIYPYYNQKVKPILYQHTCISRMFSQNSNNHRTKEMVCINVSKCFVFLRRIVIVVWSILNTVQFCAVVIVLLRSCVLSVCMSRGNDVPCGCRWLFRLFVLTLLMMILILVIRRFNQGDRFHGFKNCPPHSYPNMEACEAAWYATPYKLHIEL